MTERALSGDDQSERYEFDRRCVNWIAAMAGGDEGALNALYDATLSRVYGLALRIIGDEALAEDVVSQCYFEAWNGAARYRADKGRPLTWLLSICRNRALDEYRRRSAIARGQEAHANEAGHHEIGKDLPDLLAATRDNEQLNAQLASIEEQDRHLIALAFFRGLSHQQIAEVTGQPLGSIKSRIRRALASLAQALSANAEENGDG